MQRIKTSVALPMKFSILSIILLFLSLLMVNTYWAVTWHRYVKDEISEELKKEYMEIYDPNYKVVQTDEYRNIKDKFEKMK